jgi:hypothetical protein
MLSKRHAKKSSKRTSKKHKRSARKRPMRPIYGGIIQYNQPVHIDELRKGTKYAFMGRPVSESFFGTNDRYFSNAQYFGRDMNGNFEFLMNGVPVLIAPNSIRDITCDQYGNCY